MLQSVLVLLGCDITQHSNLVQLKLVRLNSGVDTYCALMLHPALCLAFIFNVLNETYRIPFTCYSGRMGYATNIFWCIPVNIIVSSHCLCSIHYMPVYTDCLVFDSYKYLSELPVILRLIYAATTSLTPSSRTICLEENTERRDALTLSVYQALTQYTDCYE